MVSLGGAGGGGGGRLLDMMFMVMEHNGVISRVSWILFMGLHTAQPITFQSGNCSCNKNRKMMKKKGSLE